MRAIRPLEAVLAISLVGSVLAISVPTFFRNVHLSRLAEPLDGLKQLGLAASVYASAQQSVDKAYPEDAPMTPDAVPRGSAVLDDEAIWEHPTWVALGVRFTHPHFFSFSFDSSNGAETSEFVARANGDLDGDGLYSQFELAGKATVGSAPVVFPIDMDREVE